MQGHTAGKNQIHLESDNKPSPVKMLPCHPGPASRVYEATEGGMGLERKKGQGQGGVGVHAEAIRSSPECRGKGWRLGAQEK